MADGFLKMILHCNLFTEVQKIKTKCQFQANKYIGIGYSLISNHSIIFYWTRYYKLLTSLLITAYH